jgi:hypothetical protein
VFPLIVEQPIDHMLHALSKHVIGVLLPAAVPAGAFGRLVKVRGDCCPGNGLSRLSVLVNELAEALKGWLIHVPKYILSFKIFCKYLSLLYFLLFYYKF